MSRDRYFKKDPWACGEQRGKNTVCVGQMWQLVGRFNEWRAMGPSSPKREDFTKRNAQGSSGCASTGSDYLVLCPWVLRLRSHYRKMLKVNIYIDCGFAPGNFIQFWVMVHNAAGWVSLLASCAFLFGWQNKKWLSWMQSGGILRCGFAKY